MNNKKIILLPILSMLLLTLTCTAVLGYAPEEIRTVYYVKYGGLTVEVEAPYQVDPGEKINITLRVRAYTEEVCVKYMCLNISGVKNETDEILLESITITELEDADLAFNETYEYVYEIAIPTEEEISPGLTYGKIWYEWTCADLPAKIPPAGFTVTYVKNLELEGLQETYNELNATYNALLDNHTKLESKYAGELGSTRNLVYAFVGTTIVAVATAAFLFLRRPQKVEW